MVGLKKIAKETQDNTPQAMSLIKPYSPITNILNITTNISIPFTQLTLPDYVPNNADGVFLNMRITFQSGSGIAGFIVTNMSLYNPESMRYRLYSSTNVPLSSLCPYVEVMNHQIQYSLEIFGIIEVTIELSVMGWTVPLEAHKHKI